MAKYQKILSFFLILSISVFLILPGCSKDSTEPAEEAPPVPPASTLEMDFEAFPDTTSPAPFQKSQQTTTYANWGYSALSIVIWNSILTVTLAVPVAAFHATIQVEPELQPDGRWLWSRNFNIGGVSHTAKLYGRTVSEGIEWEMYISKDGVYTDFKWYTGLSNLPVTEGTWTLYKAPANPVEFLLIEWHRNPQQDTGDIKYTNIEQGNPGNGGYIYYEKTNNTPFNAGYDIFNSQLTNLTEIEWHRTTREGRVRDPNHFQDSLWHCWDMNLMDLTCP